MISWAPQRNKNTGEEHWLRAQRSYPNMHEFRHTSQADLEDRPIQLQCAGKSCPTDRPDVVICAPVVQADSLAARTERTHQAGTIPTPCQYKAALRPPHSHARCTLVRPRFAASPRASDFAPASSMPLSASAEDLGASTHNENSERAHTSDTRTCDAQLRQDRVCLEGAREGGRPGAADLVVFESRKHRKLATCARAARMFFSRTFARAHAPPRPYTQFKSRAVTERFCFRRHASDAAPAAPM